MIVLDIACGAAHAAEIAAPHVRQVVGIDITPSLLDLGSSRLRDREIPNVLLQNSLATALPFVDSSFDLVFCRNSIHHFSEPPLVVAEMARVCRSGGRIVLSDMVAPTAGLRDAFDDLHHIIDPSHTGVLLEKELGELLTSAVGPLTGDTCEVATIAIDDMLTTVADRARTYDTLRAEIAGGPETGFRPTVDGDRILVSFTAATVQGIRTAR